jgi:AcrR family transcriptional regulator
MPRPKRTPDEIKQMRERILDATIELLEDEGISGLSIRKIARRASVSHMVLYNYFENREALFASLRDRQKGRVQAYQAAALQRAREGDARTVLEETMRFYVDLGHNKPRLFRLLLLHPVGEEQAEQINWVLDFLTGLIELCIRQKTCAARDPRAAALAVFCMVNGPLLLHHSGRLQDQALLRQAEDETLQATMSYLTECNE